MSWRAALCTTPSTPLILVFVLFLLTPPVPGFAGEAGAAAQCACESAGGETSTQGHTCGHCAEVCTCACSFGHTSAIHAPGGSRLATAADAQPLPNDADRYTDITLPVPHRPPIT